MEKSEGIKLMNFGGIFSGIVILISFILVFLFIKFMFFTKVDDNFWIKNQECFSLGKRTEISKNNKVECK